MASVLKIDKAGELSLKQFEESDPPYKLPDDMDIFKWSVPFLVEKVMSLCVHLVQKLGLADEDDNTAGATPDHKAILDKDVAHTVKIKKKNMFKKKV